MYEVEVKAHLRDRASTLQKLESLGCKFGEPLHQVDHIFIKRDVSFPPPFGSPVLRLRDQDGKHFFTLKISQSGRQDSIERELEISDPKMMNEIIELIGWKESTLVDKMRTKAHHGEIEVCLDEVAGLGSFIEVEKIVTHDDPAERIKIQNELCEFLETLGVAKEDLLVNQKYDIMLEEVGKKLGVK